MRRARAQRGPSRALCERRGIELQIGLPLAFSMPAALRLTAGRPNDLVFRPRLSPAF
jgi:hypothetical protein